MAKLPVVEQVPESAFTLTLGFADEQPLRHWCDQHDARLDGVDYGQGVTARLTVADAAESELRAFCAAQGIALDKR